MSPKVTILLITMLSNRTMMMIDDEWWSFAYTNRWEQTTTYLVSVLLLQTIQTDDILVEWDESTTTKAFLNKFSAPELHTRDLSELPFIVILVYGWYLDIYYHSKKFFLHLQKWYLKHDRRILLLVLSLVLFCGMSIMPSSTTWRSWSLHMTKDMCLLKCFRNRRMVT